ncbi:MAG: hypothetical protein RLO01_09660 [Thalassobaculaceae bacterium]|uniref:hypothetical protein n=1 Tax=Roseitalea porphyridii TaxID=1852022 RepID=UPI0032EA9651
MSTGNAGSILLAGGSDKDVTRILDAAPWLTPETIELVASSDQAVERLRDPSNPIALFLVERDLAPRAGAAMIEFVRKDRQSPYPGLAMGLVGDGITETDLRRTTRLGCPLTLNRPFDRKTLGAVLRSWPTNRSDFIVSGGYVGPERRLRTDKAAPDRRTPDGAEQVVASTVPRYDIASDTVRFRFKRFPAQSPEIGPALALRNGLQRRTVLPAFEHIGQKKEEGLSLMDHQAKAMETSWNALQATLAPPKLRDLNVQAAQSARLSVQRGLTLIAAITGSLTRYSAGSHGLGPRLVSFLRLHLDGVEAALKHRIDDDGGETGRTIISTLKRAERAFTAEQTLRAS